jgi:fructose-bisphosphate aldolase, class II
MLLNLAKILAPAVDGGYSVACFNVFGWEDARAVVDAAIELKAPVILAVNLDFRRFMPIDAICVMLRSLGESAPVPVCVHLDHTYDLAEVLRAVDLGFTSVMYDGSQLTLEENLAGTLTVAQYAHAAGCSVEAEIGSVPYAEGRAHIKSELTEVPGATIDFARLAQIEAAVKVPLVIHGTSGLFDHDIARLARTRIAKFNIGTVLRQAFGRGLRETLVRYPDRFDRLEIMRDAMPVVSREAMRMIRLLGWRQVTTAAS